MEIDALRETDTGQTARCVLEECVTGCLRLGDFPVVIYSPPGRQAKMQVTHSVPFSSRFSHLYSPRAWTAGTPGVEHFMWQNGPPPKRYRLALSFHPRQVHVRTVRVGVL